MKNVFASGRAVVLLSAIVACVAVASAQAMTLAEREKMELKQARRAPAAAPKAPAEAQPKPAPKPKVVAAPVDLHGLSNVPDRFLQPLQGSSCGCEAYADAPKRDLIFSSDGRQGIIYRKNQPYFLPHLLHSSIDGADSNLYGSTDLRIRTKSQQADAGACSSYRDVPANGRCANGTIDVVINNENQKPIKAVFVCGC